MTIADERFCGRRGGNCQCQQAAECTFDGSEVEMIGTPWKRWFAWHPVELQFGGWAWLCYVERSEFTLPNPASWMIGCAKIIKHYRLAQP